MNARKPLRFLITDDHAVVRRGLKQILSEAFSGAKFGEATNVRELLDLVREREWDVVLLDLSLPGRSGLDAVQEIKMARPAAQVLILSMHPEDQFAVRCLRLGADGYMTKDAPPEVLLQAVRKVAAGGKYVSADLAERLATDLSAGGDRPAHELLSSREFEVMRKIAAGRTAGEIAVELHLSVKTVSTYRSRVLQKMNLRTNADIMHYAFRAGLES